MKATISLEGLLDLIHAFSLSASNKRGLGEKLIEEAQNEEESGYISKEEILAGIKSGLEDLKAGRKRPLDELIKELEDAVIN